MTHSVHFPILEQLGLSESEALIYELLLELGRKPAQDLVEPSALGRGNVYNILTSLKKKGLVTEIEGKKTVFEAAPPSKLAALLDRERSKIDQLSASFSGILPLLTSEYNLSTSKPVIQIFEGLDGIERALNDSLTAKSEILTYLDPAEMKGEVADINKRYVTKRRAKGIAKRIILPNNETAKQYLSAMGGELTKIILASKLAQGFKTAMEVYDNKVSFLTMGGTQVIAVIIEDPHIANLQRAQFEYIWAEETQAAAERTSGSASDSNAK